MITKIKSLIKTCYLVLLWKIQDITVIGKNFNYPLEKKREKILQLTKNHGLLPEIFIETGTYLGDTIYFLRNNFKKLISIELDEKLYNQAASRFKDEPHITIMHGDSGKILKKVLEKIDVPAVFWLDGHYSGSGTAKSNTDTPITKEIEAIVNHPRKDHLLLIDDARLFNGKNDYPTIKAIKDLLKTFDEGYSLVVDNDIIIITHENHSAPAI